MTHADLSKEKKVWIWEIDEVLLDKARASIAIDYDRSTMQEVEFWNAREPLNRSERLVYSASVAVYKKLGSYDFFPPDCSIPVITTTLRQVIEGVCAPEEVAFHPCEIRVRGKVVLNAWNLYPLNQLECIDRTASDVVWDEFFRDESRLRSAAILVFRSESLGVLNICRLKESPSWIVVSDKLKNAIEIFNSKGIVFRSPEESTVGKDLQQFISYS